MQKLNLTLALAAGLLGGFISRNVTLPSVHAQNPTPAPFFPILPPPSPTDNATAPREIRAQSFTLVDGADNVVGTFTVAPDQWIGRDGSISRGGRIVLRDARGREIWSAGNTVRPLSENIR